MHKESIGICKVRTWTGIIRRSQGTSSSYSDETKTRITVKPGVGSGVEPVGPITTEIHARPGLLIKTIDPVSHAMWIMVCLYPVRRSVGRIRHSYRSHKECSD